MRFRRRVGWKAGGLGDVGGCTAMRFGLPVAAVVDVAGVAAAAPLPASRGADSRVLAVGVAVAPPPASRGVGFRAPRSRHRGLWRVRGIAG